MENFNRKCPTCGQIIYHKSERSCAQSKKTNLSCQSCAAKERVKKYGYGEAFSQFTEKGAGAGDKNVFYGKTHSKETIQKIKNRDKSFFQTKEYKEKQSKNSKGSNNPMYGKNFFEIWVQKYGLEEANCRMKAFKSRQSLNSSGPNNPMYGKPTPQGSGNGWSGWYKNWFFRSLKELSYAVSLDQQGIEWKSAGNIKIKYTCDGIERTYIPDFIVGNKMVEVKPTRLRGSKLVLLKEEAAVKYCKDNTMFYEVIDPTSITFEDINKLVQANEVKFIERYAIKFKQLQLSKPL